MPWTPGQFVDAVRELKFENAFNPHSERCSVYDHDDAPLPKRRALLATLNAAVEEDVDSPWLGRDLGYRGGRRTGLALTDDVNLIAPAARCDVKVERPTKGEAISERTAEVVWSVLQKIEEPVFYGMCFLCIRMSQEAHLRIEGTVRKNGVRVKICWLNSSVCCVRAG